MGLGLKTRMLMGLEALGYWAVRGYRVLMKTLLIATALSLIPAAALADLGNQATATLPAQASVAGLLPGGAVAGKDKLVADIETWRNIHLARVFPPDPLTLRYEPRLNDIDERAKTAKTAKDLERPTRDFEDWKQALLREKFATAQSRGLTSGTLANFTAEQVQQAEFSSALRSAVFQQAVQNAFVRTQQQTTSPVFRDPARYFDGMTSRSGFVSPGAAGPSVAAVAVPDVNPKDPSRYAKVRAILISEGARPAIVDLAIKEAIRQNADPLLVLAVIKQESGFNAHAHSGVGARGLMQIMPDTGRGLGVRDSSMLYDAQTNLRAGIRYLKQLWTRFTDIDMTSIASINPFASHDVKSAVAAYNAGPGAVHKYSGVPPYRETQGYVKAVLGYYSRLRQSVGI
jgi:soluble lytic murein transglycosylase-like protein